MYKETNLRYYNIPYSAVSHYRQPSCSIWRCLPACYQHSAPSCKLKPFKCYDVLIIHSHKARMSSCCCYVAYVIKISNFILQLPQNAPSSVTLQPAPEDTGKVRASTVGLLLAALEGDISKACYKLRQALGHVPFCLKSLEHKHRACIQF